MGPRVWSFKVAVRQGAQVAGVGGTVVCRPCLAHHAVCLAQGAPSSHLHKVPQRVAATLEGPDFKAEETRIRGS